MVRTQEEAEDKPLSPVTGVIGVTDLPQGVVEWCPTGLLQHLKLQDHPLKEEEDFNQLVKVGGKLVETTHHLQEVLVELNDYLSGFTVNYGRLASSKTSA